MGLVTSDTSIALLDTGTTPEFFANGVHDVEVMGSVCRFVLYLIKRAADGTQYREATLTVIMPSDAIGPGIALTIERIGPVALGAALGSAAKALVTDLLH